MKVGLDALTLKAVSLDPLELLELTSAHGLEGLHFSARLLEGRDDAYVERFAEEAQARGLYLELAAAGVNPGQSKRTVAEMVADWIPLFPLARKLGAPILNTCFGLLKERTFSSPTLAEQIDLTIQVLRELSLLASDYDQIITMELFVDLTALELLHIIEEFDSLHVRVNLDTANALGHLEDPVDAARTPWRHTCIQLISRTPASILLRTGTTGWAARRWGAAWLTPARCRRDSLQSEPEYPLEHRRKRRVLSYPNVR